MVDAISMEVLKKTNQLNLPMSDMMLAYMLNMVCISIANYHHNTKCEKYILCPKLIRVCCD